MPGAWLLQSPHNHEPFDSSQRCDRLCFGLRPDRPGDLPRVGAENSSLGELFSALKPQGVGVLDGFATTADAYRRLLGMSGLEDRLRSIFASLDTENLAGLAERGQAARTAVLETLMPDDLRDAILSGYQRLCARLGREPEMAVRSSATAEDLPEASFAGAAETFLNVRGGEGLLRAVHACYSSLFTDRAISYRARLGYDQLKVALSVGVMPMVRSDKASSGVIFTLDTESGFRDVVTVSGAYGLGEFVVQGVVTPDEWTVFKPTLATGHRAHHWPAPRHEGSAPRLCRRQQRHAKRTDAGRRARPATA